MTKSAKYTTTIFIPFLLLFFLLSQGIFPFFPFFLSLADSEGEKEASEAFIHCFSFSTRAFGTRTLLLLLSNNDEKLQGGVTLPPSPKGGVDYYYTRKFSLPGNLAPSISSNELKALLRLLDAFITRALML